MYICACYSLLTPFVMFDTFYATAPDRQALVKVRQSEFEGVLTPEALEFLTALHRRFDAGRLELLAARQERQKIGRAHV